jgi:hypothetical protein
VTLRRLQDEVLPRRVALRGRAPDGLVYTLGVGRFGAGDVKLEALLS